MYYPLKNCLFALACLLVSLFSMPNAIGQTIFSGIINTNTTWTKAKSPYQISGATTVAEGAVLTIEAGVVVNFISPLGIVVIGKVEAMGALNDSIYFSTVLPIIGKGNFKSFFLQENGSLNFQYVSQRGGYTGQRGPNYFVSTESNFGNIDLVNSRFTDNDYIFFGKGGENKIFATNCQFGNSKYAIASLGVQLNNCHFDSQQNAALHQIGFGTIQKCKFTKIEGRAIEVNAPVNIVDCDFEYNDIAIYTQSVGKKFIITGSRFKYNELALQFTGIASTADSIYNNQFCDNFSNVKIDINNKFPLNLSNNCWCETDTAKILAKISAASQTVVFPLHISCRPCVASILKDTNSICSDSIFRIVGKPEPDMISTWSPSQYLQSTSSNSTVFLATNDTEDIISKKIIYTIANPVTGCSSSDSVTKIVLPKKHPKCRNCTINLQKNLEVCAEKPINIGLETENIFWKYQWTPSQQLDNHTIFNPQLITENNSNENILLKYNLQIVDSAAGCSSLDSVVVNILPKYNNNCNPRPTLHVYNTITPNHDGKNETFFIENLHFYTDVELSIFNKWGMKIFHTHDYQNDWAAEGQPDGTYFYHLVLSESGQKLELRDHFIITASQSQ